MIGIIFNSLLNNIGSTLTLLAIILACWAYRESRVNKHKNYCELLLCFRFELEAQKAWINTDRKELDFSYYRPGNVFKINFEAPKELMRRSDRYVIEKIDVDFGKKIAIFLERVEAFNQLVGVQDNINANFPDTVQKIRQEYENVNSKQKLKTFEQKENLFKKNLKELKVDENFYQEVYRINKIIHHGLIGKQCRNHEHKLSCLYEYFQKHLACIEKKKFDQYIPMLWNPLFFTMLNIIFVLIYLWVIYMVKTGV